ncbi:hypothetical protein HN018_26810 (plasmid) [Lichenicola cladoniae]|uniref:Uncharacterized protein n=1 Tax=Lichenicola cladoniae TaxID=1484109 RepID=A0A6M8HYY4_9PROT|nr:hypothetical protein [Lichenicola cladoniae]NPD66633.1 hypothetical protein [Acetobacteraceae bacterium]QKE93743.1 hypothetical protein HN018_26810 [Lichenicola cladoniae]
MADQTSVSDVIKRTQEIVIRSLATLDSGAEKLTNVSLVLAEINRGLDVSRSALNGRKIFHF